MKWWWVALGGAAGSLLRFGITGLFSSGATRFPTGTLLVNLAGCFVIGLLWGLTESKSIEPGLTVFLFPGLLGGFTTFSAFALEWLQLVKSGSMLLALGYLLASVCGGLLAA